MRSALIHGALLAIMLVYGYRTWTRDKTAKVDLGSVVLWSKSPSDVVSIEYKTETKIITILTKTEGKDTYLWGNEVTITKPPKPAGSAAPAPTSDKDARKTREFPVGEAAEKLVAGWADARALRDLGKIDDKKKADYKLVDPKATLTVTFKDGAHSLLIGDNVFSTGDYAFDAQTGTAYVVSHDLIKDLVGGQGPLQLADPRGFELAQIDSVTIEAGGKSKTFARVMTETPEGKQVKAWGDPDTKKGNQIAGNFIDNTNNLRPTEYLSDVKVSDGTLVAKLIYKGEHGHSPGTLSLYRWVKPGELAPGQELDPANPPPGSVEYFIMTEKTRVPGLVVKATGERAAQDLELVLSDKPPPEPAGSGAGSAGSGAKSSITPHGNPFGKGPLPPTGTGSANAGSASAGSAASTTPPKPPTTPPTKNAGSAGSAAHPPTPPAPPKTAAGSGAPAPAPAP
jgi:hypothetical protein